MADRTTSLKVIIDKVYRHPMMSEISIDSIIDYTIDFMQIVGAPKIFSEKEKTLQVTNNRAELPCDYIQLKEVRSKCNRIKYKDIGECNQESGYYKVQGNYIFFSDPVEAPVMAYYGIEIDEEGYPIIPDNSSFMRALELYIKKQWFTMLFDMGKLHGQVLQNVQQEYAWAVGDCTNEFNRLTPDQLESLSNTMRTLINPKR